MLAWMYLLGYVAILNVISQRYWSIEISDSLYKNPILNL